MDKQSAAADWRVILLLLFSLCAALMALTAALLIAAITLFGMEELVKSEVSPLSSLLLASGLAAIGILFLPIGYYSLQRLRGLPRTTLILPPLRPWAWIFLPLLWVALLILASLLYDAPGALIYAPALHFLSVALPIYLLARVAVGRIALGSHLRAWSVLGSSMSLSLGVATALEMMLVVIFVIVVAAGLVIFNPTAIDTVQRLLESVENAPDLDSMLYPLAPVIEHPLTLIMALLFLSGCVPFIEEFAKSLGVWLVSGRLSGPAQGFALGALSGAGFALVESLIAAISPDASWGMAFVARAFSGLMHILAASLTGLGIAYARLERRYLRFTGLFALAILVHGLWNGGTVLTVLGGARIALANPEIDLPGALLGAAGVLIIAGMAALIAAALLMLNAWLAKAETPLHPMPPAIQEQPQ